MSLLSNYSVFDSFLYPHCLRRALSEIRNLKIENHARRAPDGAPWRAKIPAKPHSRPAIKDRPQ